MQDLVISMLEQYHAIAYTQNYIIGFAYKKMVYMATVDSETVTHMCKLDKASGGCGCSVRFSPKSNDKKALIENAQMLCSLNEFEIMVKNSKYNRGEMFEKKVTEYYNQKWQKDNTPFTIDGDITINGIPYQIKYQRATFCNEKSLASLCLA